MDKASDSGKREGKAFSFGIDDIPLRPWRENRLIGTPTEASLYLGETKEPLRVEIQDVSRSGMRLVLDQQVSVGSAVKVETTGMVAGGEIRYCRQTGENSFHAGMRIDFTYGRK